MSKGGIQFVEIFALLPPCTGWEGLRNFGVPEREIGLASFPTLGWGTVEDPSRHEVGRLNYHAGREFLACEAGALA